MWEKHPDDPLATTDEQYADYQAINTIFHNRMDQLCEDNEVPWTRWGPDGGLVIQQAAMIRVYATLAGADLIG